MQQSGLGIWVQVNGKWSVGRLVLDYYDRLKDSRHIPNKTPTF